MGTPTSSESEVLEYVLGSAESILRPPMPIEYALIIEQMIEQLKPRLKYLGFKQAAIDGSDSFDRVLASKQMLEAPLSGTYIPPRVYRLHIGSIQLNNSQAVFYLEERGSLLVLEGTRQVNGKYDRSDAAYFIEPPVLWEPRLKRFNRLGMTAYFQEHGTRVAWDLVNALGLMVELALFKLDERREALARDHQYTLDVFGRLKQLTGKLPPSP